MLVLHLVIRLRSAFHDAPAEVYNLNPERGREAGREKAGRIEVDNVTFRYRDEQAPVFEKFNLTIEPGA